MPIALVSFREYMLSAARCIEVTSNGLSGSDYDIDVLGSRLAYSPRIARIAIQDFILLESLFVVVDR